MVYEAKPKAGANYILAGLVLGLSIIGWCANGVIPTESTRVGGVYPITGWTIVIICTAIAVIFIRRALDKNVHVRADERGLFVPAYSPDVIPWSQVTGYRSYVAGLQRNVRQQFVRFALRDPGALPKTGGARHAMDALDRQFSFGDFGVNTTYLDHGMDELLAALRHYRPDLAEG